MAATASLVRGRSRSIMRIGSLRENVETDMGLCVAEMVAHTARTQHARQIGHFVCAGSESGAQRMARATGNERWRGFRGDGSGSRHRQTSVSAVWERASPRLVVRANPFVYATCRRRLGRAVKAPSDAKSSPTCSKRTGLGLGPGGAAKKRAHRGPEPAPARERG